MLSVEEHLAFDVVSGNAKPDLQYLPLYS